MVCGRRRGRGHVFCAGCGSVLAPEAGSTQGGTARLRRALPRSEHSELKQISVLFVDLCGSTERVAASDPETAREYLDRALGLMSDAVQLYGGTVSQRRGDGLLALFGAPVAHEDHPLRACLAALAMQERVRSAYPEGHADRDSMVLRVGIHSGEAVVGLVADYIGSYYRADGPTVHLASRLEQLAKPGRVLFSEATWRHVGDQIESVPLGLQRLRGFEQLVELHELVMPDAQSAAAPLTRKRRWAPFVGRENAMAHLTDIAHRVLGRRMHVVGLQGEAGVGKSRLLAEFCTGSLAAAFDVCTVHTRAYLSESPYSLAADLAKALLLPPGNPAPGAPAARRPLEALVRHWGADAEQHLPAFADLGGTDVPHREWHALMPKQRRRRIGDALAWLVQRRSSMRPLLLVIEDLFLADDDSQRLLESLVRRMEGRALLLCASYRGRAPHRWSDFAWFSELRLAPLGEPEMVALTRSIVGRDASLSAVVSALVERSDGKPFFLEQLAITLIDDGTLIGPPGDYRLARPAGELRIPPSIVAVIAGLVDRLPRSAKASLEAAAILGEPISAHVIGQMQSCETLVVENDLQSCITSGLLKEIAAHESGRRYAFRHALVQDAVISALTAPRRKELHRGAFHALRASLGESAIDRATVLTHHAVRGEDWAEAVAYATKAIARAIARSANREGKNMFAVGLDALARVEPEQTRLSLEIALRLEALGAQMPLGELDEILANLQRADAVAKQLGDHRRMASVSSQLAAFLWMRGRYAEGMVYANQARDAGALAQRRNLQMTAEQVRLMMNHGLGNYREAIADGHRLQLEFAAELEQPRLMSRWATIPSVNLQSFLASSLWRAGDVEAAQQMCDLAYADLAAIDHPYSRGLIDFVQAQMWLERGRFDEAVALMRASVRMCETLDVPTLYPCAVAMLAGALAHTGMTDEALALLTRAFDARVHDAGGTYGEFFMRRHLASALSFAGRHGEAIAAGREAVEFALMGEQYGHHVEALGGLAEVLVAAGRAEEAIEVFATARRRALQCGMNFHVERAERRGQEVAAGLRVSHSHGPGAAGELLS